MKKGFILVLVLSLFCLSIPQTTIFAENSKVVINVDSLNVRSGPGLSYSVVAGVSKGDELEVLGKEGDWIKVKISNTLNGWVASWLVTEKNDAKNTTPETVKEGELESIADGLRIRKGPGTSFQVVGSVNKGDVLQYKEKSESWVKIVFNQVEGWVHSDYIKGLPSESTTTPPHEKVVIKTGSITASSLNVRLSPSTNAAVVGALKMDDQVNIYTEKYDWFEINLGNKTGWIHKDYVKLKSETSPNKEEQSSNKKDTGQIAVVTATALNVRDDFSLMGSVISQVKKGDQLEILSEQNNWCQVKLSDGKTGWVAGWYVEKKISTPPTNSNNTGDITSTVTILYDATNIRSGPSTNNSIIHRAMQQDTYTIIEKIKDWYKITLSDGRTGYVAGWIVSTTGDVAKVERPGMNQYLAGKTIVIDPGHGGRDSGAKGVRGTFEKTLTLRAAKLLDEKLRAAGAKSVLTRNQDVYVSLNNRVSLSHYYQADAFISIHFDSSIYPSVSGITTYYYTKSKDYSLGESIQTELVKQTSLRDRGVQYGNFQVLRHNNRPSVLLELGFLSNITEEALVGTPHYQEQITTAIFNGLAYEFKK